MTVAILLPLYIALSTEFVLDVSRDPLSLTYKFTQFGFLTSMLYKLTGLSKNVVIRCAFLNIICAFYIYGLLVTPKSQINSSDLMCGKVAEQFLFLLCTYAVALFGACKLPFRRHGG